jgi:hypothetical protein
VRLIEYILQPLEAFFRSTNHDYKRFNYLGEWHSHHSFELIPSREDHLTMMQIANDPAVGANFVVLLIVKSEMEELESGLTVYCPTTQPFAGIVVREGAELS